MADIRIINVVDHIVQHPGVMPSDLADLFSVSDRTIRTYVKSANESLAGVARIDKARGAGFYIEVADQAAFERWCADWHGQDAEDVVPTTSEGRANYMINYLLNRDAWITLEDLSHILFVSKSVISGDLKQVEQTLARFNLALEKRPRYGIRVEGSEMNRRLCLANSVLEGMTKRGGAAQNEALPGLDVIQRCVNAATSADKLQINSAAYQNLLVHIAIAVARMRSGAYIPPESIPGQDLYSARELAVARSIAKMIGEEFEVEFPESEVAYIAIHLAGKQTIYADDTEDAGLVISDDVWNVVAAMLEVVWRQYHFDLRGDLELRMNLARHIVPLSVRLRLNMHIDNPLLHDIRTRYPLAYSMALDAASVLADAYGAHPDDKETGYIALSFALALERRRGVAPKKNILVVCASGQGSAKLLEYRYRQEFGSYLDRIVTCDASNIDNVELAGIDYVITTVPLKRTMPVPVHEVKFFLDDADRRGVRELLSSTAHSDIERYFSQSLFVPHISAASKDEAIDALCEVVRREKGVDDRFRELVYEREQAAETSFGNQVAMPHPSLPLTEDTFVTVGLLDEPVIWNGAPVRAVFLVSVSTERDRDLSGFYRTMADVLTSEQAIQRLVDTQDYQTLLQILAEFGKTSERK